jgi:hypothetical protein
MVGGSLRLLPPLRLVANLIWGKVTIGQQKIKTEVGNDQLEFTGMIDFLNKVYICVYFF